MSIGRFDTAITPRSLAEQVKGAAFKNAVMKVPEELFKKTEEQFCSLVSLTPMDYRIKESFWQEYARARLSSRKMDTKNIYGHICTYTHFYNNLLHNPNKLAWILSPIRGIPESLDSFKSLILNTIHELLMTENHYKNGRLNLGLIKEKIHIFRILTESTASTPSYKGGVGETI